MAASTRSEFRLGEWEVSPALHRIRRGGEERPLEPKVMQVLVCLSSRPGAVISHDELIDEAWGGMAVSTNVVTYSIAALRKALEDDWRAPRVTGRALHRLRALDGDPRRGLLRHSLGGMCFVIEWSVSQADFSIRFEDVILVTEDGHDWLTEHAPIEPDEIEALMAQRGIWEGGR